MEAHAEAANDPRIGMVLQERYRILRKLGEGGMGAVYEGEHLVIKKRVAIKVQHPQFANNPEIVARFHREAEAATSIGHPNIIEVNDMGRFPDGAAYMVLEFLKGRDWSKDIATEGPQPLGKVVHIMSQVCDALSAAHAKGIVHRDLKPENIFLLERGNDPAFVKVVDFGISKMHESGSENRSLTQTGTALGTPYYMAPEQCQGKKDLDPRADIYSLGVIVFQALTRRYPFDDESYPMLVLKICTEPPPPLSYYRTDLPPEIQHIVSRMLAKNREERFQSCAEVKAALEPFRFVNAPPELTPNPPSLADRGPSVLAAVGPAKTPLGTAYLPDSTPGQLASSPPAYVAEPKSGKGVVIAAVGGVFALLVAAGISAGIYVAQLGSEPDVAANDGERAGAIASQPAPQPAVQPVAQVGVPTAPPVEAPVVQPPPQPAPQQTVHVRISATPANARIFLDGEDMGNPFDADVPRDPDPAPGQQPVQHLLRVEAPGYQTVEQHVSFRWDNRNLPIVLERGSGTARPRQVVAPVPTTTAQTPIQPTQQPATTTVVQRRTGQTAGAGDVFGTPQRPPDRVEQRRIFR
jgi:serine/threonine protein kinase